MWAIFDLETTGLDLKNSRVIEYAVVLYEPKRQKMLASSSQLVYEPGVQVTDEITDINGIDLAMLVERSCSHDRLLDVIESFFSNPDVTHIAAHNAFNFDVPIMEMEFIRKKKAMPKPIVIDTYVDVPWGNHVKNKSLTYLCTDHGFLNPWPHRALPDTLSLMKLLSLYDYKEVEKRAASPTLTFWADVPYDDREKPKAAGFKWQSGQKKWIKVIKAFEYEAQKDTWNFPVQQVMGV